MEAIEKNAETVNAILEILEKGEYTVQEAYSILDFVKGRIKYTSKYCYLVAGQCDIK